MSTIAPVSYYFEPPLAPSYDGCKWERSDIESLLITLKEDYEVKKSTPPSYESYSEYTTYDEAEESLRRITEEKESLRRIIEEKEFITTLTNTEITESSINVSKIRTPINIDEKHVLPVKESSYDL